MKHISKLLLLPMVAMILASFSTCGGLTDEEKKFLGTWSSEIYLDSMEDDNLRYIATGYGVVTYNEDKTYDDEFEWLLKFEFDYTDVTARLYMYIEGTDRGVWSAKDGVFKDSTTSVSFRNEVSPHSVLAIRNKRTGRIERYGLNDASLRHKYKTEVVDMFKEFYKGLTQYFNSIMSERDKNLYNIVSLGANRIVYEDNDGEQTELKRGRVVSLRVSQMQSEGNALK